VTCSGDAASRESPRPRDFGKFMETLAKQNYMELILRPVCMEAKKFHESKAPLVLNLAFTRL
jgi:hypothetical protein